MIEVSKRHFYPCSSQSPELWEFARGVWFLTQSKEAEFLCGKPERVLGFFITMMATTLCALRHVDINCWELSQTYLNTHTRCLECKQNKQHSQAETKSETPSWTYLGSNLFKLTRLKKGWFKFGLGRGCNSSCRSVCECVYLCAGTQSFLSLK